MSLMLAVPLLLTLGLEARENPFAPPSKSEAIQTEKVRLQSRPKVHPQLKPKRETSAVEKHQPKIHPQRKERATEPVRSKTEPKIHPQRKTASKEVINTSKARFVIRENSLYIETQDKMLRSFSIANPPSIVMDFKGRSDFASKRKVLHTSPFTKLEMGAHGNRYRVVLRLDKKHKYKIENARYGKILTILK